MCTLESDACRKPTQGQIFQTLVNTSQQAPIESQPVSQNDKLVNDDHLVLKKNPDSSARILGKTLILGVKRLFTNLRAGSILRLLTGCWKNIQIRMGFGGQGDRTVLNCAIL